MPEQLEKYYKPVKDKWTGLTKDQKMKIIMAIVILATSLIAFTYITLKPKMVVLQSNLTFADIGEIEKVLDDAGVVYTSTNDSISVDEKDYTRANVLLAGANVPTSKDGYSYSDAFSNNGMTTTDSVKKESFRLAAETEIEKALETMDGVVSADAKIVVPENNSYFIKDQAPATASVILQTNKDITKQEGLTMARVVALSVQGLSLENIEITDQNYTPIYSGLDQNNSVVTANNAYEQELIRKEEISNSVKKQLTPLYTDVIVNTNLKVNWDDVKEASTTYNTPDTTSPNTGFISSTVNDKSQYENTTPAEAPGTATNGQAVTYDSTNGDASTASTNKSQTDYLYDRTETQVVKSIGTVDTQNSSISVVVYNNKIYDEQNIKDQGLLANTTWAQYKATIPESTPITIDQSLIDSISLGTGISQVSVIGYEVPYFVDTPKTPIDIKQIIMFIVLALLILMLAVGLIKNTQKEEITEVEPELSVEDLLLSTQIEEEKEIQRLKEIEFNEDNETKKQIDKFVNEKPDAVAQLLRNWLSEDWE